MSLTILTFGVLSIFSLLAMIFIYTPIVAKYTQTLQFKFWYMPFIYIFTMYAAGLIISYFFHNNGDFLEPLTFARAFTPLLLTAIIFYCTLVSSTFISNAVIVVCTAVTVFMQPLGIGAPFPAFPPLVTQIGLVVLFSLFCIYYRALNILPQLVIVPSIMILCGIAVMSFLEAAPTFLALSAAALIGSMTGFLLINLHSVKVEFDNATCCALAYLIGSIMLMDSGEYSFISCLIFTLPFWVELVVAVWRKYIFDKAGTLEENTNYKQAAERISMYALILNVARICTLALFLGWFQLFSVNSYSLLIVSFALIFWFNNSLGQAISPRTSLKDINKEFVENIKKNMKEAKDSIDNLTGKGDE